MLWLGKKIFKLREKLTIGRGLMAEDEEKPFLDHLEDLRKTLMKMIVTLVVTMIGSFVFSEQLFLLAERPVLAARIDIPEREHLPKSFATPEEWPIVIGIAHGTLGLDEAQRKVFLEHAFRGERAHLQPFVQALLFYHASLDLPPEERQAFLKAATAGNDALLGLVQEMTASKVDAAFERGAQKIRMWASKPAEGFNLSMKLALYAGLVVGFPLLLYFLLEFIVPGLKKEERRVLWPAMAVGFGLFLIGVTFAYYVVVPKALRFFFNYDQNIHIVSDYRMTDYVSFVIQFTLIFGLCFELPVIVFALNKLGILSYQLMRRTRSYAVIIIIVICAIITPTADLVNLSLLAVPMMVLYELSIWIAFFHDRRERKRETAEEAAAAARRAQRREPQMAAGYLEDSVHPAPGDETSAVEPPVDDSPPFSHDEPPADESPAGVNAEPGEAPPHFVEGPADEDAASDIASDGGDNRPADEAPPSGSEPATESTSDPHRD